MSKNFTRRDVLAGAAALAVAPLPALSVSGDFDVAIVGAGAAGIAAARRIATANRSYVILEATGRAGGRIASAIRSSGAVYDRGANRFSAPAKNPLIAIARLEKQRTYEPPAGRRLYVGSREARDGEYDDFTASLRRASRTIGAVAELGRDFAAARALPDLGNWQGTVGFVLGPLTCAKDLDEVSSVDLARADDRPDDVMMREGTEALIAAATKPLNVELNTAVQRIDMGGRGRIEIGTTKGTLSARTAIVTSSTNVLASGRLGFSPLLPPRVLEAANRLSLGTYERIVFELPGNPFRFNADERVIFKTDNSRAPMFHMRVGGTDVTYADIAGRFGRELSAAGEGAVTDFVVEQLTDHFGSGTKIRINKIEVTRWSREPYVLGGFSAAAPGAGGSRRALMEPISDRIFIAGEAAHETMWGTVAGAGLSGERAADAALRYLGVGTPQGPSPRAGRKS
jgi:monoamine oxidase